MTEKAARMMEGAIRGLLRMDYPAVYDLHYLYRIGLRGKELKEAMEERKNALEGIRDSFRRHGKVKGGAMRRLKESASPELKEKITKLGQGKWRDSNYVLSRTQTDGGWRVELAVERATPGELIPSVQFYGREIAGRLGLKFRMRAKANGQLLSFLFSK